jgi:transposase
MVNESETESIHDHRRLSRLPATGELCAADSVRLGIPMRTTATRPKGLSARIALSIRTCVYADIELCGRMGDAVWVKAAYRGGCRACQDLSLRAIRHGHPPGHAQVDFGEAVATIAGVRHKIHFFCMDLPHSDACFVKAYPRETTEAFLDGHVAAFAFFGGVPLSILYDNTKIAVAKICGDGQRERTRAFTELVSHYLFRDRFGRPGRGNDKGKVEGLVKFARSHFMTLAPEAASFEALNADLERRCQARQEECAGRHPESIGTRLVSDRAVLRALPAVPLEPCEKRAGRVSSTALVRYRGNDYSVPTAYGFRDVLVKGFVEEVVILCGGIEIARHPRSYGSGVFVAEPLHYLALIETKPNALDQAAALQGWDLPEAFQHLRHLLEARMGNRGKREFIQVLRLMEAMPKDLVAWAVTEAIRLGAIGFDAVKLIALARLERRPPRLDLSAYPHLPRPAVRTTMAADYTVLVPEVAA